MSIRGGRRPTYGAATRLARLVLDLASRPDGRTVESIARDLGVSARTAARYVAVLQSDLVDGEGRALVDVCGSGPSRRIRLRQNGDAPLLPNAGREGCTGPGPGAARPRA